MGRENEDDHARRRAVNWLALVMALIVLTIAQIWENQRRTEEWNKYSATQRAMYASNSAAEKRLDALHNKRVQALHGNFPSAAEAEELLAESASNPQERAQHIYVDRETCGRVELQISNGEWFGNMAEHDSPPLPPIHETIAIFRRLAYMAGYAAWTLMLIAFFVGERERRKQSLRMLVLAIVATYLAMLGPQYWHRWNDFFQDDSPGWGYLMILISVVLVASTWRRKVSAEPTCAQCGYNLTGNESGICPECGTKMKHPGRLVTS